MPARIFRVQIINATDWPMTRVTKDQYLHGDFTPGGWTPPDRIEPRSTAKFQAESGSGTIFQGTSGHVTYYLQEYKEQVEMSWSNPWVGGPSHDGHLEVSSGAFDDWRVVGPESRYYKLERYGPWPLGTYPGGINTDGWLEVIPGVLALPLPFGSVDHAWGMFKISRHEHSVGSLGQPITTVPPLLFAPSEGAPRDAWFGTWVYPGSDAATAEVSVRIGQAEADPGIQVSERFRVSVIERSSVAWAGPLTLEKNGVVESVASVLRYAQDIWPPRVPIVAAQSNRLAAMRAAQQVTAAPGEFFRVPDRVAGASAAAGMARRSEGSESGSVVLVPRQRYRTIREHLTAQNDKLQIADTGDSLILDGNITLMLYSVHVQGGQPLGYGVRYLRGAEDGISLADVMLLPAFRQPA